MTQLDNIPLNNVTTEKKSPKIVGEIRHYPPANKEWRNSVYAFNKNNIKSLPALDKMASKTIKSYFNLSNNKKLARSRRMRNLLRRSTVKRLFVSRPEIKQTSDKVNLTVYTFDREKQFLLRKMYFYNRNITASGRRIHKDIYLYRLWLKKNLLAFKNTFTRTKPVELLFKKKIRTNRNKINETFIHSILVNKYANEKLRVSTTVQGNKKALYLQNMRTPSVSLLQKIKRNLIISLKLRNLTRSLKKREIKKGFRRLAGVAMQPLKSANQKDKALFLRYKAKNYFANKVSRKVRLILRNKHSIVKIKQKLKKLKKSRYGKIRLPYSNLKFKNEIKFFSFRLSSELKYIRKLFFYYFIKYVLSLFQIKTRIEKNNSGLSKLIYEFTVIKETAEKLDSSQSVKGDALKNKKKVKFINRYSSDKLKNIDKLNLELLNFLRLTLAEGSVDAQVSPVAFKDKLDTLYKKFESNYFLTFLSKFFKKEFLYINYYSKFLLNQLKFGKFLPGLKLLISKIYSKKVELNLVNLKYPHLNTDIYTDSIATKLRKKVGLLRVLRWSLKLARLPYKYYSNNNAAKLNSLQNLNIFTSLDVNSGLLPLSEEKSKFNLNNSTSSLSENNGSALAGPLMSKDRLDVVLNKLFPNSLVRNFSVTKANKNFLIDSNSKVETAKVVRKTNGVNSLANSLAKSVDVLNIIRYKWVSGVRLEAAGRLTRRYTAARSVFKYRYKGSLKNIDYSQKTDTSKKNVSTVMLRNYVKANSQYSFTKSKRRIGAFGLKGWISSY